MFLSYDRVIHCRSDDLTTVLSFRGMVVAFALGNFVAGHRGFVGGRSVPLHFCNGERNGARLRPAEVIFRLLVRRVLGFYRICGVLVRDVCLFDYRAGRDPVRVGVFATDRF